MTAREQICAVLASATFEHCRRVKAAGREQPAVPERHVFPTKQRALDFLHFRFTFLVVCNNEPSKTALFHC